MIVFLLDSSTMMSFQTDREIDKDEFPELVMGLWSRLSNLTRCTNADDRSSSSKETTGGPRPSGDGGDTHSTSAASSSSATYTKPALDDCASDTCKHLW